MADPRRRETPAATCDYDATLVGASLASCTAAILLARAGAWQLGFQQVQLRQWLRRQI
jgi:thioredoxin reductase